MPNYGFRETQKAWRPDLLLPSRNLPREWKVSTAGSTLLRHASASWSTKRFEGKLALKPRKKPKCYSCGKCCKNFTINIMPVDVRRWKKEGRQDILSCLMWDGFGFDAWFDSKTGEELRHCPFLQKISRGKYICSIQETKPFICKMYWCAGSYGLGKRGEKYTASTT